ncbi:glucuronide transporter [Pseudoruegeria aquimaris]|uniref:Glucuronide transporter n=1 Tax=Pseudoruegeria aquimaris TaxID=393663 RepID=A0A1Y5TK51_9RHOB|nr:MFS transporter [Pseudoruegeria aquimaris]SLN66190.1 glucuronide transporter [Pseudoruegeria aquimaris]
MYPRVALFAAMLAFAGLPLYVHLPRFATGELGLSLAALGGVLLVIRLMDFLQDPFLGWLADRPRAPRRALAALGAGGLAAGFLGTFAFAAPFGLSPAGWLLISLALVFTAYSLLMILFYGEGVKLAAEAGPGGHVRLAGLREAGTAGGIILATALPSLLAATGREATAYRDFALVAVAVILLATLAMWPLWRPNARRAPGQTVPGPRALFANPALRFLLLLGFVNAMPVAATSTLFLFFVEDRLALPQLAGPFLLLFFAAAGATAPLWSRVARRFGVRRTLLTGMALSVAAFLWAAALGPGQGAAFAIVCLASGAAVGADMVLLPALFAATVEEESQPEGLAFGLWAFVAKAALALAAGLLLPLLDVFGFVPGQENSAHATGALVFAYALLPCALKLIAMALVLRLPRGAASGPAAPLLRGA